MSFSSYSNFGASLSTWMDIGANDLGSSLVADLITVGEARIFREARTQAMETSFGTAIVGGIMALPSGYLALKSALVSCSPPQTLERRTAEWIGLNYPDSGSSGIPKFIARYGQTFIFGPYPDSAYTISGIYYQQPAAISASGLNALFTTNPDLYLFGCLAESEIVIGRDPRVPLWEAKYAKILADVNGTDRAEDASGSTLQTRVAKTPSYRAMR